ncbi:hypothetical protein AAC387_Pa09g1034 [Persea americana]
MLPSSPSGHFSSPFFSLVPYTCTSARPSHYNTPAAINFILTHCSAGHLQQLFAVQQLASAVVHSSQGPRTVAGRPAASGPNPGARKTHLQANLSLT